MVAASRDNNKDTESFSVFAAVTFKSLWIVSFQTNNMW